MAAKDKSRIGGLWLVYGIPGTGKTLIGALADGIVPAVEHGRTVYTNVSGLSIAGISSVAGVPPICVDVRFLETIEDVVNAFDSDECNNSVFVLDEMKQMLARDKNAVDWLCQRLNIMRKRSNDFIMIAQVPEYFNKEVRSLALGCTLYKRLYSWGSRRRTQEFRFNGGDIVISSGKLQPASYRVRTLPEHLFMCYKSGIDGLIGVEENGRSNSVWKSPKAFLAYAFVIFALLMVGFGVYIFFSFKSGVGGLASAMGGSVPAAVDSSQTKKAVQYEEKKDLCYSRKICDSETCETNAGVFPFSAWSVPLNAFVTPAGLVKRCPVGE